MTPVQQVLPGSPRDGLDHLGLRLSERRRRQCFGQALADGVSLDPRLVFAQPALLCQLVEMTPLSPQFAHLRERCVAGLRESIEHSRRHRPRRLLRELTGVPACELGLRHERDATLHARPPRWARESLRDRQVAARLQPLEEVVRNLPQGLAQRVKRGLAVFGQVLEHALVGWVAGQEQGQVHGRDDGYRALAVPRRQAGRDALPQGREVMLAEPPCERPMGAVENRLGVGDGLDRPRLLLGRCDRLSQHDSLQEAAAEGREDRLSQPHLHPLRTRVGKGVARRLAAVHRDLDEGAFDYRERFGLRGVGDARHGRS